ncbi:hypothetical protein [Nocardia sp. NPDC057227]|uniref:hypothetical protein n=1 Tax=Nocardia sp. NPDC057227 TaxID=3346056 RepID=UPI00362937C9
MWRGKTWEFTRPAEQDRTGDYGSDSKFTVSGCLYWTSSEVEESFGRNTITASGILAVPHTKDVRVTDRPKSPAGDKFTIVGQARWGEAHPLTGRRFGFKFFEVKEVQ